MSTRRPRQPERDGGLFYGWYIVGALFFATFLGVGARQGYGVFVKTWEEDFGVSVGAVSTAAAVGWFVNGISQPIFGRLTDRFGGRPVLISSLVVMGVATAAMAAASNILMLIAIYGFVVSFAAGGISFVPAGALVARWFQRRRGTAMAFLTAGGSAGGLIMVPFAAYLLIVADWRTVWLVLGGMMLFLGLPVFALVLRGKPADMGLEPDGGEADGNRGTGRRLTGEQAGPLHAERWRDSFRSPPMWQLSFGFWVCGVTTAIPAVHYVRWASEEGISAGTAALAFGALSAINGVGVIAVGWVSDRMQRRILLGGVYMVRCTAYLALIFLDGSAALWGFAVLGGMSWLATVPLTTSLTADVYGLRHLGTLSGLVFMSHHLGGALAVLLTGVVFDRFGTYDPAFGAGAVFLLLAGLVSLSIRERTYSARYQPQPAAVAAPAGSDD
ncbi:MAG: MFS transporter [Dehalococcoidia bacterium]